jgi:hypothetical protein
MAGIITNPLSGIIEGMLKGHHLAQSIKRQQMEEAAFKTNQALHEQQMSIQDIMNRQMLDQNARPVQNGQITSPAVEGPENPIPGTGNGPGLPAFSRSPEPSRTVKYGGQQYELKTPEEQHADEIRRQISGSDMLAEAQVRAAATKRNAQLKLEGGGIPAKGLEMFGIAPGTPLTRAEALEYEEKRQNRQKAGQVKLGPGETLLDTTDNSGGGQAPREIATGAPLEDAKTRAARAFTAELLGKPAKEVTSQELAKGIQQWELATMNPLDKSIKQEEVLTAPLNRQVKQSTLMSQALERTVKSQELELANDADTVNTAATKYLQTGNMPQLGMGSALLRGKIMARATELAKENGIAPEAIPGLQETNKALSASLVDMQKRLGQISAFEQGGAKNLDNFIRLAEKQADTGSPILNRTVRGAARTIAGSPDQAAADAARVAAFNEISKILSGSLGNAGISDAGRKEAEGLLRGDYTMKQLLEVSKVLRQDMKNRSQAYADQIAQVKGQMQGLTKPNGAAAAAGGNAGGGLEAGRVIQVGNKQYRYNGTGATDDLKNYTEVKQ